MAAAYLARETPFGPYAESILALWAAHLHDMTLESAAEKRRRWYEENPAGAGACVVLQAGGEGRPIGVQCLLERRVWSGVDARKAAGLAEFAIDPAHRSLGPALSLLKKCLEIGRERYDLVYGLPNPTAFSVCKRAGLVHAGDMVRYILPLRPELLLRRRNARALRWLAPPAALALRAALAARALRYRAPSAWREANLHDAAVSALWERRPRDLWLSERGVQALAWRFNAAPGWKLAVAAMAPAPAPFGYVVWRQVDDFVEIGDFFCAEPDRQTAALLSGFARHIRGSTPANGVEVEFCGRAAVVRGILGAGFLRRSVMCPVVVDRRDFAEGLNDRLYFTTFDRVSD